MCLCVCVCVCVCVFFFFLFSPCHSCMSLALYVTRKPITLVLDAHVHTIAPRNINERIGLITAETVYAYVHVDVDVLLLITKRQFQLQLQLSSMPMIHSWRLLTKCMIYCPIRIVRVTTASFRAKKSSRLRYRRRHWVRWCCVTYCEAVEYWRSMNIPAVCLPSHTR